MKKRNKALLAFGVIFSFAFAIGAAGIAMFAATLAPFMELVLFDVAILGAGLGVLDLVALTASLTTGYVKRRSAAKKQADSFAKLAKTQNLEFQSESINEQKLAKTLSKSTKYIEKNKKLGVIGDRENTLKNEEDKVNLTSNYSYSYNVFVPSIGEVVADHRASASLHTKNGMLAVKKHLESQSSVNERYNKKNKNDYGYVAYMESNGSTLKPTYVKSNYEGDMEKLELLMLKDCYKSVNELNSEEKEVVFPITLGKRHYEGEKKYTSSTSRINNQDQLKKRIEVLTKVLDKNPRYKANGDYMKRKYSISPYKDEDWKKLEDDNVK